ncbi:MAG: phosphatidate cytidylyltransferase [Chitinophagaceae bacterium]|jgi:phosphatidate cytidylyltransferase
MAFDPKVFATRTKTAVVYAVVMLTGLLWNEWSFFILFSIVHAGAWKEYLQLAEKIHEGLSTKPWWKKMHFPLLGWSAMMMSTSHNMQLGGIAVSMIGAWLMRASFILILVHLLWDRNFMQTGILSMLKGFAYVSVSLILLVNLRSGWIWNAGESESMFAEALSTFSGHMITLLIVFGIWINDTMAYVVGSMIGKNPLSKWSPKKTWEGTIGGIVLSVGLINLFAVLKWNFSYDMMILSLAIAIAGTLGDLYESRLKRLAGVKDSGNFMPGHGGFLDRFDSILFASPVVWVLCYLFYR